MKLVYLDNSHKALLAKLRTDSPLRFDEFLKEWRANSCILALSEAHIYEITRHRSPEEQESRFEVLKQILPIRAEIQVFPKELILALRRKNVDFVVRDIDLSKSVFSDIICQAEMLSSLLDVTRGQYSSHVELSHNITRMMWQPQNLIPLAPKGTKKIRLIDLPDSFPQEYRDHYLGILRKAEIELSDSGITTPIYDHALRDTLTLMKGFISNVEANGVRGVVADLMNLDLNNSKHLRMPIETLDESINFLGSVKFHLPKLVYGDDNLVDRLCEMLTVDDCPGRWLKSKVENQLRRNNDLDPSNELDTKHLSHLPYVDVMFCDKRILGATKQVFENCSLPKTLAGINLPIAVKNDIDSLENALFG